VVGGHPSEVGDTISKVARIHTVGAVIVALVGDLCGGGGGGDDGGGGGGGGGGGPERGRGDRDITRSVHLFCDTCLVICFISSSCFIFSLYLMTESCYPVNFTFHCFLTGIALSLDHTVRPSVSESSKILVFTTMYCQSTRQYLHCRRRRCARVGAASRSTRLARRRRDETSVC
jgi:hypothetical protein